MEKKEFILNIISELELSILSIMERSYYNKDKKKRSRRIFFLCSFNKYNINILIKLINNLKQNLTIRGLKYFLYSIYEIEKELKLNVLTKSYIKIFTFLLDSNEKISLKYIVLGIVEHDKIFEYFKKKSLNMNIKNHKGANPLMISCGKNSKEIIKKFLKEGIDINAKDNQGNNALFYTNEMCIADLLIEYGIKEFSKAHFFYKELDNYKKFNNYKKLKYIEYINTAYLGYTPITYIIPKYGYGLEELKNTAKIDTYRPNFISLIKFLLRNGADINLQNRIGETALHYVAKNWDTTDFNVQSISNELEIRDDSDYFYNHMQYLYHDRWNFIKNDLMYFLINSGIDINIQDNIGNTALHYLIKMKDTQTLKQILSKMIMFGLNINLKNKYGDTIFHYLLKYLQDYKYFKEISIEFVHNGADIYLSNNRNEKVIDLIENQELKNILVDMYRNTMKYKPKKLINLLKNFTKDNPLKYTTHSFEWSKYGSYQNFIDEVKKEFEKIEDELKILSPNLYTKINKFLFDSKLNENNSWGENKISFGWSSPELKEWCNNQDIIKSDKKAIYFPLPNKYQKEVEDKTLSNFGDICNVFKNEIEIREDNRLHKIFQNMEENILGFDFEVDDSKLGSVSFYTDVQFFKSGVAKIYEQFKERKEYNYIELETKSEDNFIEIFITQIDSIVYNTSSKMIKEIKDGDFYDIKNYFLSLCDWSIEAKFKDGNFRIKYLSNNKEVTKEPINNTPIGFTHILRFYK